MDSHTPLVDWIKKLPISKIEYPTRLHRYFFSWYTKYHAFLRDTFLKLKIFNHSGRQNYLLGKIAEGVSVKDLILHLIKNGYGNHFIAWKDSGEIASLRRTTGRYQHHIRIFEDGEVRGHYEYTPEHRPIAHYKEIGFEDRREEFLRILEGMIIPHPALEGIDTIIQKT